MLEHVAQGQTRFLTPGVAPDSRGVLLGRFGLLLFPSLEGAVSWLRLYAAESSLDELMPGLEIETWETPLRGRATAIRIPISSSYVLDRAARCARLAGGNAFTGTSKHFVKYRDDRSPFGYDAAELAMTPAEADYVCHGESFVQTYRRSGSIAFDRLLYRLSLRRVMGKGIDADARRELLILCAPGLADGVVRYLWRNRVTAEAALVRPRPESSFAEDPGQPMLAIRIFDLPERILDLFRGTPGIHVFALAAENVAVELGYAHPIDLTSCRSLFAAGTFTLFWGAEDRVDVITGGLETTPLENLTRVDIRAEQAHAAALLKSEELQPIGVELRLEPSMVAPRNVCATLVPLEQQAWLKKLVFLLPQASLHGHRVAVTDRGILVVADDRVDVVPLGHLLVAATDGVLIPLGMDIVPRVAEDVLAAALGHAPGVITVFPPSGVPFQIKDSDLQPLERRVLAKIEVTEASIEDRATKARSHPQIKNDAVGRFALWGLPDPAKKGLALPVEAPEPNESDDT
jgi:hypothetical protein